jgi:hypothetical protein
MVVVGVIDVLVALDHLTRIYFTSQMENWWLLMWLIYFLHVLVVVDHFASITYGKLVSSGVLDILSK